VSDFGSERDTGAEEPTIDEKKVICRFMGVERET